MKKRLQGQVLTHSLSDAAQTVRYNGLLHCFRTIQATEGLQGLYRVRTVRFTSANISPYCYIHVHVLDLMLFVCRVSGRRWPSRWCPRPSPSPPTRCVFISFPCFVAVLLMLLRFCCGLNETVIDVLSFNNLIHLLVIALQGVKDLLASSREPA